MAASIEGPEEARILVESGKVALFKQQQDELVLPEGVATSRTIQGKLVLVIDGPETGREMQRVTISNRLSTLFFAVMGDSDVTIDQSMLGVDFELKAMGNSGCAVFGDVHMGTVKIKAAGTAQVTFSPKAQNLFIETLSSADVMINRPVVEGLYLLCHAGRCDVSVESACRVTQEITLAAQVRLVRDGVVITNGRARRLPERPAALAHWPSAAGPTMMGQSRVFTTRPAYPGEPVEDLLSLAATVLGRLPREEEPPPTEVVAPVPKDLKDEEYDDTTQAVCNVCYVNKIRLVCVPCGHGCLCVRCYEHLERKLCPICKGPVKSVQPLFLMTLEKPDESGDEAGMAAE